MALIAQGVNLLKYIFEALPGRMFPGWSLLADSIKAVQEGLGRGPGSLYDPEEPGFHFGSRSIPETDHIIHLCDTGSGDPPGASHDAEALHREIDGGLVRALVMPVADHDIFGNQVDSPVGIIITCLPLTDPRSLTIDQPVSPDP